MVWARMRVASVPRSAVISDARANRKSPVRMAIEFVQRALAETAPAAQDGFVHHVVVVQRRQMGELDGNGRRYDGGGFRITEAGGQEHDQRTETLSARVDEVARGLGDERDSCSSPRIAAAPPPRSARAGSTLPGPDR